MRTGARVSLIFLLFVSLFASFLGLARAPQDIDLLDVPQAVGDSLGVSAWVGGLLMSAIIFIALVGPTLFLRNKAPTMIISVIVLGFLVSVGFLDTWIILILILMISVLWASKIKRVFT